MDKDRFARLKKNEEDDEEKFWASPFKLKYLRKKKIPFLNWKNVIQKVRPLLSWKISSTKKR